MEGLEKKEYLEELLAVHALITKDSTKNSQIKKLIIDIL